MANQMISQLSPTTPAHHAGQRLCDCRGGTCVQIVGIEADDATCRTLLSMGLTHGTQLAIHQTPHRGGPVVVGLRGTHIALRSSDAAVIQVSPLLH